MSVIEKTKHAEERAIASDNGLRIIAVFKMVKAVLLLSVGIGLLALLHRDVEALALQLITALGMHEDNRLVQKILVKLSLVDDRKLELLSAGSAFYAALLATEGIGLWLRKRWAEYLTIIATASFIPLEIYELARRITAPRIVAIVINVAILLYLIARVRYEKHHTGK